MVKLKTFAAFILAAAMAAAPAVPAWAGEASGVYQEGEAGQTLVECETCESERAASEEEKDAKDLQDRLQIEQMFAEDYLEAEAKYADEAELASEFDCLTNGDEINQGGTYYIDPDSYGEVTISTTEEVRIEGSGFVMQTNDKAQVNPALISLKYTVNDGNLVLCNTAMAVSMDYSYKGIENTEYDRSGIFFKGGDNTICLEGVNLIEQNRLDYNKGYAMIHIERDDDGDGQVNSLSITTTDPDDPGMWYMYARGCGAGIGSDGWQVGGTTNGRIFMGSSEGYGPVIFAKTSQSGSLIGRGLTYSTDYVPENITFYGGEYYLMTVSGAAGIGGAAPTGDLARDLDGNWVTSAGIIFVYGGTININMDWVGAAMGSGGYRDSSEYSLDDKDGGYLLYSGGTIRTYKDLNAAQMWTRSGSNTAGYGVDFYGIDANIRWNGGEESFSPDSFVNPEEVAEQLPPLYALRFNTKLLENQPNNSWDANYSVYTDAYDGESREIYNGTKFRYYFICERLYKTEQGNITTTYTNWDTNAKLNDKEQENNLYFMMPAEDYETGEDTVNLTVNDEYFSYQFEPVYHETGEYEGMLDSGKSGFKLMRVWNDISGGERITQSGAYELVDETPGTITIDTEDLVYLRSDGDVSHLTLTAAPDTEVNLRFEGLSMSYSGTVLNLPAGGTIELYGDDNVLAGTSTTAGYPALNVGGDLTVQGDQEYSGYSTADMLTVTAAARNAAVAVARGGSFTQVEGTVNIVKKGAGDGTGTTGNVKGAVSGQNASIVISRGAFSVASDGGSLPGIYAGTLETAYYARVTVLATNYTYGIMANQVAFKGGSIKVTGNGTENHGAVYSLEEGCTVDRLSTGAAACYVASTEGLTETEGENIYTVWKDDNTLVENRVYFGALHEYSYSSAQGFYVPLAKSGNTSVVNVTDRNLYLWFETYDSCGPAAYGLLVNDDSLGSAVWNPNTGSWGLEEPYYSAAVVDIENRYPDGGTLTVNPCSNLSKGDVITCVATPAPGYMLDSIVYYYYLGTSLKGSSSRYCSTSPVTRTITMPGKDIMVEAIWAKLDGNYISVQNQADGDVSIEGLTSGAFYSGAVQFTVSGPRACAVCVNDGSGLKRVSPITSGAGQGSFSYSVNADSVESVAVYYSGDSNLDGKVDISDASSLISALRTGRATEAGMEGGAAAWLVSDCDGSAGITLNDVFIVLNQVYGKDAIRW